MYCQSQQNEEKTLIQEEILLSLYLQITGTSQSLTLGINIKMFLKSILKRILLMIHFQIF